MTEAFGLQLVPASSSVKGPGFRLDHDVRRIWRCPRCQRVARTAVWVTSQRCGCAEGGGWMQLQPPVRREPFQPPPREPIPLPPDEMEPVEAEVVAAVESTEAVVEITATTVVVESAPVQEPPPPAPASDDFGAGLAPQE